MTLRARVGILISLIVISSVSGGFVSAYEIHDPIVVENVHATADDPYVVENYEISSSTENCIVIKNSKHVVVRNNFLHDCNWYTDEYPGGWQEGNSLMVEDSEDITIENNVVKDNIIGPYVRRSKMVKILNNTVTNSVHYSGIRCDHCTDSEIAYNYLSNNGVREWFDDLSRIIGIWAVRGDNIDIHDNTVINSTSDGIAATGQDYMKNDGISDWTGVTTDVRIYNNSLINNWEQGIWVVRARNVEIFGNDIYTSCDSPLPGSGVFFEFDVADSEVYDNVITSCKHPGAIGIRFSHNNNFHDNIHYGTEKFPLFDITDESNEDTEEKARLSGIELVESSGNVFERNDFFYKDRLVPVKNAFVKIIVVLVGISMLMGLKSLWKRVKKN